MAANVNRKDQTYLAIRAGLIRRGTNLSRWAKTQGYPHMTVYSAAKGQRSGKKATKILHELENLIAA